MIRTGNALAPRRRRLRPTLVAELHLIGVLLGLLTLGTLVGAAWEYVRMQQRVSVAQAVR